MFVLWITGSVISPELAIKLGFRPIAILGVLSLVAGYTILVRETKDDEKLALRAQGHSFVLSEELEAAEKSFDESREISARLGDRRRALLSSVMGGYVTIVSGNLEEGLPRVVGTLKDFEKDPKGPDDPARNLVLLRLAEVAKWIDKKRFDTAVKAASRDLSPDVHAEVVKSVEAGRAGYRTGTISKPCSRAVTRSASS